ncbi:MAG: 16S rRNA (uracil(1498)-N(3))-methyltransferase [Deltaproteobacteria bacterium]|nr:16S rRNA (uracil(1498)-N(3))-methyltransferase [Deltaproteobacteria bacterium]
MRIFVEPDRLTAGELVVTGEEYHYLVHVRRARVGEAVEIVDGEGRRAPSTIARITENDTILQVGAPELLAPTVPFVRVLLPLIKGDRMELCLEKLVELGADAILVWPAERSIVRLDDGKREARLARYNAAAHAAARQCGRARVPPVTFAELSDALAALPELGGDGLRLILDPGSDRPVAKLPLDDASDVAIASGPEGGLTPAEQEQLERAGFQPIGLGPRTLRAETAPMIAVALVRAATAT